ncbi:MAG: hypothetical protein HC837_01145 [Chloroflexaceae bacterium]|nr:hypothetical protein [Chloroflexaceae bacterium]
MRSRQRIARKLRGLKLSQPVAAPVLLEQDGNDAGTITSAVVSPRYGPIALAYVRMLMPTQVRCCTLQVTR